MEMELYAKHVNLFIAKIWGNNDEKFKVLIAAETFEEATAIANKLTGVHGWIISIKYLNQEVVIPDKVEIGEIQ